MIVIVWNFYFMSVYCEVNSVETVLKNIVVVGKYSYSVRVARGTKFCNLNHAPQEGRINSFSHKKFWRKLKRLKTGGSEDLLCLSSAVTKFR